GAGWDPRAAHAVAAAASPFRPTSRMKERRSIGSPRGMADSTAACPPRPPGLNRRALLAGCDLRVERDAVVRELLDHREQPGVQEADLEQDQERQRAVD